MGVLLLMDFAQLRQTPVTGDVPSSNASISFDANISNSDLSVIDKQSVNRAIVAEIRDQAPIASLSAGDGLTNASSKL